MPEELIDFAKSVISVATFSSNFFFMKRDYFSTSAELLPLLHTWSLAVEEQYYILFPLFLMFAWRFERRRIVQLLVVLCVLSLALAQWGAYNKPAEAFFLLLTRGWELAIGSFCAFYIAQTQESFGDRAKQILAALGLLLILVAIFGFNEDTPTPSFYILLPTIGTAMVILFATKTTWVNWSLGARPMVAVGLVSYSAYLWHQPIFAFARHAKLGAISTVEVLALVGIVFACAVFSWRFVEMPFRTRGFLKQSHVFGISMISLAILIGAGISLSSGDANLSRFNAKQQQVLHIGAENRQLMTKSAYDRFGCFFNSDQNPQQLVDLECIPTGEGQKFILFGDSEAAHLREGIISALEPFNATFGQFTGAGCRAINYDANSKRCTEFIDHFFEELDAKSSAGDIVIVASNWWNTHRKLGDKEFAAAIGETLDRILQSGVKPVLVLNSPDFLKNPYEMTVKTGSLPGSERYFFTQDYATSDSVLRDVARERGVEYFEPSTFLCREDTTCLFVRDDDYFYFDTGHFSYHGSRKVAQKMFETLADGALALKPK